MSFLTLDGRLNAESRATMGGRGTFYESIRRTGSSPGRRRRSCQPSEGNTMSEVPTIALRAYELWDAAGRPEGRADDFWFLAEDEFRKLLEAERAEDAND